ncbi:MAG: T9SS C-terminal target domain-containing protein [Ignavibacteriales bacterium]|nr:MAG: T9SS C-terminal target domain-containing protein [Ignavibacteriales bacterium]
MKKLWFVFIYLFFSSLSATNAQWDLRYPDIPADFINSLVFTSELNGFFVNEGGGVIQTTDGGNMWNLKDFFQDQNLYELKFIDEQKGFAYVSKNVIYPGDISLIYTTDAGDTWNESGTALWGALTFLPISENRMIQATNYGIQTLNNFYGNWQTTYNIPTFLAGDTLYYQWEEAYGSIFEFDLLNNGNILAIGNSWNARYYNQLSDSVSFILRSIDSGESWDTLWCDLPYELKTISFINDQVGWIAGEQNRIYKTIDGGANWTLQYVDSLFQYWPIIEQIFALDEMNIYGSTLGGFIRSTDGGNSWQSSSFPDYNSLKIFFKNPLVGYAYGSDLLKTTDGGISWNRVSRSIKDQIIKIDFVNTLKGWALSYDKLYVTTDGGFNWQPQFSYNGGIYDEWGLEFVDSLKGYIIGSEQAYTTIDGGIIWDSIAMANDEKFFGGDVDYYNSQLGLLCNIYKESVPGSNIYDIPVVLLTTDGGLNWIKRIYTINAEYGGFKKIRFVDPEHIYGINFRGLWLSSDTAKTWQKISDEYYFLGSVSFDFINGNDGCYSDVGYNINFTTNAGVSWMDYELSKYVFVNDYQLVDKDVFGDYRIFAAGNDGRILKYIIDNSSPDTYPNTYTSLDLHSISLYMEDRTPHLWVGGDGFSILHSVTEIVSDIDEKENIVMKDFTLSQNYPNPFNPTTKIRWQSPIGGWQTLKVYDVLGNEVATLVNEYKNAGSYEVNFDASKVSSGIYFYQLQAGSFIETKKMLLLK